MTVLADVILRDTRANQPAAGTNNNGYLYCVTDEGDIIERSNGSAWQSYSPTGGGGGSGGLILIETKIITAATTTVTFSGLDGDADVRYRLVGQIQTAAQAQFFVRPNGVSTNLSSASFRWNTGGTSHSAPSSWGVQGDSDVHSGRPLMFQMDINAAKVQHSVATYRTMVNNWIMKEYSVDATESGQVGGMWTDTTNNITTLDVMSTTTNAIDDGSIMQLFKYEQ